MTDQPPIRTKWMDPDFRRDPKTNRYCEICQRDLAPDQPHRIVRFRLFDYEAIHPEDWGRAAVELSVPGDRDRQINEGPIGLDCARRLGLEWTKE